MAQMFDFAVIGAGIAGASVAAELARTARVVLIEMEDQPGYHTTGRSAAVLAPGYGPAPIRALTRASVGFFHQPPKGFCDVPLVSPLDVLMIAREDQLAALDAAIDELSREIPVSRIDTGGLVHRHPMLRKGYAAAGMLDTTSSDIDVHALHRGYLSAFHARGGTLRPRAQVTGLKRDGCVWQVQCADTGWRCNTVVNAAGAWADRIGALAGARPIGLVPKRRTALVVDAPDGADVANLPLVVDIDEQFYMKSDAGRLLMSPANEDPMAPCDVQPDEMDIALCIDRIERAFDFQVRRIVNKWAGLRSFVTDKSPVVGFAPDIPGFFWLAGQGGYGIQSAPALSRFAAALAAGQTLPGDILDHGLDPASLSPERLEAGS